jgi:hypothetical protein
MQVTSFDSQPLHIRHKDNLLVRLKHLPIGPSPPHPDNGILLELEGEPLRKKSYVKIGEARTLSIQALELCGDRRLSAKSYKVLIDQVMTTAVNADLLTPEPVRHTPELVRHTAQLPKKITNDTYTYSPVEPYSESQWSNAQSTGQYVHTNSARFNPQPAVQPANSSSNKQQSSVAYNKPTQSRPVIPHIAEWRYNPIFSWEGDSLLPVHSANRIPSPKPDKDLSPRQTDCALSTIVITIAGIGLSVYLLYQLTK